MVVIVKWMHLSCNHVMAESRLKHVAITAPL